MKIHDLFKIAANAKLTPKRVSALIQTGIMGMKVIGESVYSADGFKKTIENVLDIEELAGRMPIILKAIQS